MEICVGEYVRFKNGLISKVTECRYAEDYKKQFEPDNRLMPYQKDKYWLDNKGGCVTDINIIKHSKNIIDLIEVGDYVNGVEISALKGEKQLSEVADEEDVVYTTYNDDWGEWAGFAEDEIKTIVTKEQMKSIEYRLEG